MHLIFVELLIVAAAGLALGSFATAMIYRVPRNIPWAFGTSGEDMPSAGRSVCPHCRVVLSPLDLVPIFSWICLRGRCRKCKALISVRYPLTEIGVVLACLGAYIVFGFNAQTFFIMAVVPFLAALLVIDLEHMILPNQLVLIAGVIGLARLLFELSYGPFVWASLQQPVLMHVMAAVFYAALSWFLGWFLSIILKKDSLGFGDVKFFAVAGLWLGFGGVPVFLILSGFLGIVFSLIWKKARNEAVFPFGPALITSLYGVLLLQGSLLS